VTPRTVLVNPRSPRRRCASTAGSSTRALAGRHVPRFLQNISFVHAVTIAATFFSHHAASASVAQPGRPASAETHAPQVADNTANQNLIEGPALAGLVLERRGQKDPMPGEIISVSPEGVRIRERTLVSLVSWDVVRRIRPAANSTTTNASSATRQEADAEKITAQTLAKLTQSGENVWRAAARLERGDWRAAEPLFQPLFSAYFPTQEQQSGVSAPPDRRAGGPTAQIVTEGLLRCRLQRGAYVQAVEPWFRYARLAEARAASNEPWIGGRLDLEPVLDAVTKLAPAIPPIWPPDRIVERVSQEPFWQHVESGPGAAAAVARLYRASLEVERGVPIDAALSASSRHRGDAGLELARDILVSRGGRDVEERESARRRLLERARSEVSPRWMEAWCRAAVGRSLIRESAEADRRRGMIELMHLPARFSHAQPSLTFIALCEVAWTLDDLGEPSAAATVRKVLVERFGPESLTRIWPVEPFDAIKRNESTAAPSHHDAN